MADITWVDWFTALGAVSAAWAASGATAVVLFYGRKVDVSVSGSAHAFPYGNVVVTVRPAIRAVGVFRFQLGRDDGARVTVTEVMSHPTGLRDGRQWEDAAVFSEEWVTGGETMTTLVLFDVGEPAASLCGWRVALSASVRRFMGFGPTVWYDRVFVPRPDAARLGCI